jgi:hypothetical protein
MSESTPRRGASGIVMGLLRAGVPLSLLMDLTTPDGPESLSIYYRESPGWRNGDSPRTMATTA